MAWVTGVPGIGNNLNKWQEEDFTLARKMIACYKQVRPTVQHGRLFRLVSPRAPEGFAATQYVAEDGKQSGVFATLHSRQFGRPAPPLMRRGLQLNPRGDYAATSARIEKR
jgi:alpha-galactosidase